MAWYFKSKTALPRPPRDAHVPREPGLGQPARLVELEALRETASGDTARISREATLSAGLKQDVANLREQLLQADATNDEASSKLAAAERELVQLRRKLKSMPEIPEPPETRSTATSPPPQLSPSPSPRNITPSSTTPRSPTPQQRAPSASRPRMRTTSTSPPPIRLPAPPEVRPPSHASSPPVLLNSSPSGDEVSTEPSVRTRSVGTSMSERPLSESLLRHTVASKQWDNHRRRAANMWRMSNSVAWKPNQANAELQTFGGQRFLQEVEKDADKYPYGAARGRRDVQRR